MKKKLLFFITLTLIPTTSFCMERKSSKEKGPKKEISFERFTLKAQDAYIIGMEYYEKNEFEEAFRYIKMAAKNNHPNAQYILATMFFEGKGCEKDLRQAMKYCSIALKRGIKEAKDFWYDIVTEFIKTSGLSGGKNPLQLVLDPSMLGQNEEDDEEEGSTKNKKNKGKEKDEAWRSMYV